MLTSRGSFLPLKGKPCAAWVRSVLPFGSEAWDVKEEDIHRLDHTEVSIARWAELREQLGIEFIGEATCSGKWR